MERTYSAYLFVIAWQSFC